MPELRHLRYALAAAQELNFTRAARQCGVTQQVLSEQIARLEDELGVRLFDRSPREVRLTAAGAQLAERGPVILELVDGLWDELRRLGAGEAGTLRVGLSRSATFETAPRLVAAMDEAHPGVALEIHELPTPELPAAVRDGRVDVAVARWPGATGGLFSQELRRQVTGVVVRADDRLAGQADVDLAALHDRVLLLHEREALPGRHDAVLAACEAAGFTPLVASPRLPFDPSFADVAEGRGVVLAAASVRATLPSGLRWIPLAGGVLEERVEVLWNPGRSSPVRDAFLAVARHVARRHRWLDSPS